jgi:hypothetical protein
MAGLLAEPAPAARFVPGFETKRWASLTSRNRCPAGIVMAAKPRKTAFEVHRGSPDPYGATFQRGGVNFSIFARHATAEPGPARSGSRLALPLDARSTDRRRRHIRWLARRRRSDGYRGSTAGQPARSLTCRSWSWIIARVLTANGSRGHSPLTMRALMHGGRRSARRRRVELAPSPLAATSRRSSTRSTSRPHHRRHRPAPAPGGMSRILTEGLGASPRSKLMPVQVR